MYKAGVVHHGDDGKVLFMIAQMGKVSRLVEEVCALGTVFNYFLLLCYE